MRDTSVTRRRWFQVSLRAFLVSVLVVGAGLGWLAPVLHRVNTQREAVRRVEDLGGTAHFGYQLRWDRTTSEPIPPGPRLFRWAIGDDAFARVKVVQFERPVADDDLTVLNQLPDVDQLSGTFGIRGLNSLAGVIRLKELDLNNPSITAAQLSKSPVTSGLESLGLYGRSVDDTTLVGLGQLRSLESLQITRGNVTDGGLVHVSTAANLRSLDLFGCPAVTDAGLARLESLSRLRRLTIGRTSVTESGLSVLKKFPQLESLTLYDLPLTNVGMEMVGSRSLLRALKLPGCRVTDDGAVHLERLPRLEFLDLGESLVSDKGLAFLSGLSKLKHLNLWTVNTTDAGIVHLRKLKQLKSIEIGPGISRNGAAELVRALPDCGVSYVDPSGVITFPAQQYTSSAGGSIP